MVKLTWNLFLFFEAVIGVLLKFSESGWFEGIEIDFNFFWVRILTLELKDVELQI